MPYIVTAYDGNACHDDCQHPNLDHRADNEPCRSSDGENLDDSYVCATLNQAREVTCDVLGDHVTLPEGEETDAFSGPLEALDALGGIIGPLPDGYMIEVRQVNEC